MPVQPSEEQSQSQNGGDQAQSKKLKELFPLPDRPPVAPAQRNYLQDRHLAELGRFYEETARSRSALNAKLEAQYGEDERQLRHDIDHLDSVLQNSGRLRLWWLKTTNQIPKNIEGDLSDMRQSLDNIEWRKQEAEQALRSQAEAQRSAIELRQKLERSELDPDQSAERGGTTQDSTPNLEDDGPSFDY